MRYKIIEKKRIKKNIVKKLVNLFWLTAIMLMIIFTSIAIGKYHFAETTIEVLKITEVKQKELPEDIVKRVLDEEGISWLMGVRLIECESRWNVFFKEKMRDGSYDRGLWAFNSNHYKQVSDECAFDPECATRTFAKYYKEGKINDWLCARLLKLK
jgi:hypothetical protein